MVGCYTFLDMLNLVAAYMREIGTFPDRTKIRAFHLL